MTPDTSTQQFVIRLFAIALVGTLAASMGALFWLALRLDGEIAKTLVQLLVYLIGAIVAAIAGLGWLHANKPPTIPPTAPTS